MAIGMKIGNFYNATGGVGGGYYQQAVLPPSSTVNTPQSWALETDMVLPAGYAYNSSVQKVIGDNIIVVGANKLRVGNLRTKTWDDADVATNVAVPYTVCVYDGYKILIVGKNGVNVRADSFNIKDKSLSTLPNVAQFTGNSAGRFPNTFAALPSIYIPSLRKVFFASFIATGGSDYRHVDPWWFSWLSAIYYVTLQCYDIDSGSFSQTAIIKQTSYKSGEVGSRANASEAVQNAWNQFGTEFNNRFNSNLSFFCTMYYKDSVLYMTNATSAPTKIWTYNITSKQLNQNFATSVVNTSPSDYLPFHEKLLMAVPTAPVLYDPSTNTTEAIVIPNTPEVPAHNTLNMWDNQVVYFTGKGIYKLPFIKADPSTLTPVFGVAKGQHFCGIHDLPLANGKPTITTQWQIAADGFEICLGEYDASEDYKILVKNT